jgi:hypothetical protein
VSRTGPCGSIVSFFIPLLALASAHRPTRCCQSLFRHDDERTVVIDASSERLVALSHLHATRPFARVRRRRGPRLAHCFPFSILALP